MKNLVKPSPKRGEVWLVRFYPQVGSEIDKVRPAVVISVDEIGALPLRIVVPVTAWKQHFAGCPWFVRLSPTKQNGLSKESTANAFQVKSVSEQRFVKRLGVLPEAVVDEIAAAIALCVGY